MGVIINTRVQEPDAHALGVLEDVSGVSLLLKQAFQLQIKTGDTPFLKVRSGIVLGQGNFVIFEAFGG